MGTGRVALVQDWFVAHGGAEAVAVELADLLPNADVYTSFVTGPWRGRLGTHRIHTWPFQRVPGAIRQFRSFLPLYPLYFGGLDLGSFDIVVSSSVAFAHAVRTVPASIHVSYVHTPMRYAWDLDRYLAGSSQARPSRVTARLLAPWLRRWDRSTAGRPSVLIANSAVVRNRIRAFWDRDAEVIHPAVAVDEIPVSTRDDDFLLVAARLLAYRRVDLAVRAAGLLGRHLVVVGEGPEEEALRRLAPPNVTFKGAIARPDLLELFARCHAYLVPGIEDFGIAPVEAMAAGKPVVAFRAGGALETVVEGETGVFFDDPNPESLAGAIQTLETMQFDQGRIRANAERFSSAVFRRKFVELFKRLGVPPALYAPDS